MSPNVSLFDPINQCHVNPSFNLFPWEPCPHAHQEILQHLDLSKPKSLHHIGRNYLASVLSIRGLGGLDFNMVHHGNCFTQQFFTSLTSINTWAMSPQAQPIPCNDTSCAPALHIDDFLVGIQGIPIEAPALPADGLSLIQAHQVENLIFHSFATLDIKENFLACPFASSLLDSCLERWLCLLDLPQVQVLWEKNLLFQEVHWWKLQMA
jgi:hypothetical protein